MRDLLIIGLRPNVSSSSGLDGVKRKFCKAPEIAKDRISLNFHIIKFANVKRYTFLKLQFLIVFCKTRLSHYNGVSRQFSFAIYPVTNTELVHSRLVKK